MPPRSLRDQLPTAVDQIARRGAAVAATKANAGAVGIDPNATNLGTFTSPLIDDNATVKAALESIGTNLAASGGSANVGFLQSGTGAVARTIQAKDRDIVSVLDFASPALAAKIVGNTATSTDAAATTAAIQAALNRAGSTVTLGSAVPVYLPDGTYWVNFIGVQGAMLIGQSRLGTVLKCASGGSQAMLDSRINRDGSTANTNGHCIIENMSLDMQGANRAGAALYGGSCIARNVEIYSSATHGLIVQYVLKTTLENVTVRNNTGNGIVIDVDEPLHTGDVNTSIKMINVWCLSNGGWGMTGQNMNYCAFDNVTTQDNGLGGTFFDGSVGGTASMNCIIFNNCASEQDSGPAYHFKNLRNVIMLVPFLLADLASDTIILDNTLGEIHGLTDTATHTGGTFTVKFLNPPTIGGVLFSGGSFTIAASDRKYCSFRNSDVNGSNLSSLNNLRLNNATDVQVMDLATATFTNDFSGMAVTAADGTRGLFVSRAGGVVLGSARGAFPDTSGFNNGDIYMHAGTTSLNFQVKGTDGVVRTGTVTLL